MTSQPSCNQAKDSLPGFNVKWYRRQIPQQKQRRSENRHSHRQRSFTAWMVTDRTAWIQQSTMPMTDLVPNTNATHRTMRWPLTKVTAMVQTQNLAVRVHSLARLLARAPLRRRVPDMTNRLQNPAVSTVFSTGLAVSSPTLYSGLSFVLADGVALPNG